MSDYKYLMKQIERVSSGHWKIIDIVHLKIETLPPELFELTNLEELILHNTDLRILPKEVSKLINLKILKLDDNKLKTIPNEISSLKNLTYLSLQGNEISSLPEGIAELSSLQCLNIADNELSNLDEGFGKLDNLKELYVYGNKFINIPDEIYKLKNLEQFYFVDNRNRHLYTQSRNQNKAKEISNAICGLERIKIFHVDAKYFQFPSPEIVARGVDDIKRFFLQIEAEGSDFLYEAKLLIVGEPGAGKTSFFRKFFDIDAALPTDSDTTRGIDIGKFEFLTTKGNQFNVNVWDFGGQEIYHSTHQFFLTKRSLYCLVCDTRKEDTSYNYWLQVIELLSDSSPVFIIHNEKQDRVRDINIGALRKRFLKLKDEIQRTNFDTKRGLPEIIDLVKSEIQRLPHVGDKLPKTWVRVRKNIETISAEKKYISDQEFYDLCEYNGITDREISRQLSNYLHDLGVFLHFKDGSILERTIILSNSWATEAVYLVLDNPKIQADLKGRFQIDDLQEIWSKDEYQRKKEELLALMLKFELCYKVDNSNIYIAPQLLPINEPVYEWDVENSLQFRFCYEFMPRGIIARLIVRMHRFIQNNRLLWREGVIVEKDNERALIKEVYEKKEIQIFVAGNQPRIFLTIIVEELDKINSSFPKINLKKEIPCNCSLCKISLTPSFYEYESILRRIENNKSTIECPISYEDVIVTRLIETTFESEVERRIRIKRKISVSKKEKNGVFVSYSHLDKEWLNNLKRHFGVIKNKVELWDDSKISPGEVWQKEIENAISGARVAILILSADFFNSEFITTQELPSILSEAENEGTVILTVVLKPCLVEEYPNISKYQFINSPSETIIQMDEAKRELTWLELVKEVKKYVD